MKWLVSRVEIQVPGMWDIFPPLAFNEDNIKIYGGHRD